jgi:hypothetical protein
VPHPTRFVDLNRVLEEFVDSARAALGGNFVGAYLQGSFAVGDADEHSDVDFIVVTAAQLSPAEQAAVQALHGRIYECPVAWAQHLEGSYAPKDELRRVDPCRRPFFYLDNGARELIWDRHCNTAVVRWSLREHGIVLAGPSPTELLDPVSADDLRSDAVVGMRATVAWARESLERYRGGDGLSFSRWKQPYLVLSSCRFLHTLESGTVSSKRRAGEWGCATLDRRWSELIQRALADRPNPWQRVQEPAEARAVDETMQFLDHSLAAVDRHLSTT